MIGQVGSNSGILGAIMAVMVRGVQTWVASANARGGVACHPVKYISYDDGGDPARRQSLIRQLVERDGAIAMVQMTDALSGSEAAAKYFEQKQIAVIGDAGAAGWAYRNTMYFPQSATGLPLAEEVIGGLAAVAVPAGKTKVGTVFCIEVALCSGAFDYAEGTAHKFGMTLAYRAKASLAQPDYTSVCQAAQAAGVEAMALYLDGNSQKRLARSCLSVNFKPIFATLTTTVNSATMTDPNLDGLVFGSGNRPWFDSSNGAVAEFQESMKRYAPGAEAGPTTIHGWAAAKMFELAAQRVSDSPTNINILEGLWSMNGNDLGGLLQPLRFTKDKPPPSHYCFWTVQVKNGKPTMPAGTTPRCQDGP